MGVATFIKNSRVATFIKNSRVATFIKNSRVATFIKRSGRVFKLARYPSRKEMWAISRVCILGIVIIGILAFIITLLFVNGFIPIIRPSTPIG